MKKFTPVLFFTILTHLVYIPTSKSIIPDFNSLPIELEFGNQGPSCQPWVQEPLTHSDNFSDIYKISKNYKNSLEEQYQRLIYQFERRKDKTCDLLKNSSSTQDLISKKEEINKLQQNAKAAYKTLLHIGKWKSPKPKRSPLAKSSYYRDFYISFYKVLKKNTNNLSLETQGQLKSDKRKAQKYFKDIFGIEYLKWGKDYPDSLKAKYKRLNNTLSCLLYSKEFDLAENHSIIHCLETWERFCETP